MDACFSCALRTAVALGWMVEIPDDMEVPAQCAQQVVSARAVPVDPGENTQLRRPQVAQVPNTSTV